MNPGASPPSTAAPFGTVFCDFSSQKAEEEQTGEEKSVKIETYWILRETQMIKVGFFYEKIRKKSAKRMEMEEELKFQWLNLHHIWDFKLRFTEKHRNNWPPEYLFAWNKKKGSFFFFLLEIYRPFCFRKQRKNRGRTAHIYVYIYTHTQCRNGKNQKQKDV